MLLVTAVDELFGTDTQPEHLQQAPPPIPNLIQHSEHNFSSCPNVETHRG